MNDQLKRIMTEIVQAHSEYDLAGVSARVENTPTDTVWMLAERFEAITTQLKYEVEIRS